MHAARVRQMQAGGTTTAVREPGDSRRIRLASNYGLLSNPRTSQHYCVEEFKEAPHLDPHYVKIRHSLGHKMREFPGQRPSVTVCHRGRRSNYRDPARNTPCTVCAQFSSLAFSSNPVRLGLDENRWTKRR